MPDVEYMMNVILIIYFFSLLYPFKLICEIIFANKTHRKHNIFSFINIIMIILGLNSLYYIYLEYIVFAP